MGLSTTGGSVGDGMAVGVGPQAAINVAAISIATPKILALIFQSPFCLLYTYF
jgi:hypothetical protein